MRQFLAKLANPAASWMIFPIACALVVIGAKCWIIARYGNPTPFWDEWDVEGAVLYPRYLDGSLRLSDLLAAHNEHRVLITRLWDLMLFNLAGYWDPILQMAANTLLFGTIVAIFTAAFRPIFAPALWLVFTVFATLMFALPFAWENTLIAFNSQWGFLFLFSIAGILAIMPAAAFTARWWIGALLLGLSYFGMASGALTVAAAFAFCLAQFAAGRRRGQREVIALALLAIIAAVLVHDVPAVIAHTSLKAHSIAEFVRGAIQIASWPATPGPVPILLQFPCAILINTPAVVASVWVIRQRPQLSDRLWLFVALTAWVALQMAAIAYGRAGAPKAPRYFDLYTLAVLVNGASLLYLAQALRGSWLQGRRGCAAITVWLLLIIPGTTATVFWQSLSNLTFISNAGRAQTENLRLFLATGDRRALENKPRLDIPYPDPQRLADVASMPVVRTLLPPALSGNPSATRAPQLALARVVGPAVEIVKTYFVRWGVLLIPLGVVLFLAGVRLRREPRAMTV